MPEAAGDEQQLVLQDVHVRRVGRLVGVRAEPEAEAAFEHVGDLLVVVLVRRDHAPLLEEDLRELSIILESFIPHLDKIGIQIPETNSLIKEIVTGTEIFRRLKGISQIELLPFAFKQVPWFTRYTHSCLTYVFGEHVINKLSPKLNLSDVEIEAIKLCFLIHDIGHGPFSHLTERAFKRPRGRLGKIPQEYDHEYWTSVLFKELQDGLFDTNNNPYLPKFSQNNTALKKHNMQIFSKAIEITSNGGKRVFLYHPRKK